MKNCIKSVLKFAVAGVLAVVISISSAVPTHADALSYIAGGAISILQNWINQSNYRESYKQQMLAIWRNSSTMTTAYNNGVYVEISGDEMAGAVYELNAAGIPCEVHYVSINGHGYNYIMGTGQIFYPNGDSFSGTGIYITNKAYCTQGNNKIYLSPYEPSNTYLYWIYNRLATITTYIDGIEGYLSGISSKLADISNKLDQLIGLSTAASALPSSYYDAIDVLGDITANYESSDDAILQRYFMNPDDPYPISPDFFSNLDRYAVYVTYDDLCKAVTKLNSIGYPSTVQYNSDLGVYYIWSNGYLMNMATHYGISGQQGIRKGYFVLAGYRFLASREKSVPALLEDGITSVVGKLDQLEQRIVPALSSIDNSASSISSSLSRIETALSNLVCHHDYRSMLVLDGESVTFESAVGGEAIDDLTLKIEPEQDYNGYNRPWAGGAGKNLLDDTQRVFAGGNIFFGGATSATSGSSITLPAGTYTFSVITASGAVSNLYLKDKASNAYIAGFPSYDHRSQSFTLEETAELLAFVYCFDYTSVDDIVSAQIESGTAVTPYEPYENLAPLSGRTGMTVTHNGNATTIDWAETAGTVYGGTFDLASGVLTSSMSMISSYAGETLPARWYSDRDVYVAGTTPTLGAQVVYVTNEPITYQLDPVPIYAALGSNVITSDCGSMTLKILDGSNLTDMGYTLIVCQNCGQVQPMFDYSRLLDKLDDLESTLSSIRINVNDIVYNPTDIDNFTIEETNDFNTIWYVGEDDGGDKHNLVDVAKDSGLKLGKLFKFIWNVALKDIFNTGGGIDDLSDFYLIEGEGSENLWDS